jgi:fatty acid desaturase
MSYPLALAQPTKQPAAQHIRPAARAVTDYSTVLKLVQSLGLMRRRPGFYIVKISALLLALVATGAAFVVLGEHWGQVVVATLLAIIVTQFMFLSHDAAHRQAFASAKANEWTALLLGTGLGGVSLGWWNSKHTRHHQAPNQIGKDPDIDSAVLRFYDTDTPPGSRLAGFVYSRQGWWFYPLLVVEALNLHIQSLVTVATRRGIKHRWIEVLLLAVRLGVYPAVLFIALPWGLAAAFLGVQLAVTGLYLGSAFAVSHIGMPVVPKDSKIDFFRRQVLMSRNVAGGRAASFAMGGLNYQIEHHLFPAMPTPNLRLARPIVRRFCADHAIDYHEVPIHRAWATVASHLNRVGLKAALAVSCPTASALR